MLARVAAAIGLFCALLYGAVPVRAQQAGVSGSRQASILTRALAYRKDLKERAGEAIVLGVVYRADHSASKAMADEMVAGFQALESFAVRGLPFHVVRIVYDTPGRVSSAIRNQGIDAIYVCAGLDDDIESLRSIARENKILSMAGLPRYVEGGLSIGVFVLDDKATIYLNLAASQQEAANFSSDFLRLTRQTTSR